MCLWFHDVFTLSSLWIQIDPSLVSHCPAVDFTLSSLDVALHPLQSHFDLTMISLWFCIDSASISRGLHCYTLNFIALWYHFNFTSEPISLGLSHFGLTWSHLDSLEKTEKGTPGGRKGKREKGRHAFSSVLTRHCHCASHARTRRNDFPVGLTPPNLRFLMAPIFCTGGRGLAPWAPWT